MTWTWSLDRGAFVLRAAYSLPGVADAGFVGRVVAGSRPPPFPPDRRVRLEQVHGAAVARPTAPGSYPSCDAAYTETSGLVLTVRTADCLPVLLCGDRGAAIVHAGWRGLDAGVVQAALACFEAPVRAAVIGPGIGPCCFEVGPEVQTCFPGHIVRRGADRARVDLAARVREILAAHAPHARVVGPGPCTRCHQHLLHSHRGSRGGSGRILAYAVTAFPPR
jgi:YfiH family protein